MFVNILYIGSRSICLSTSLFLLMAATPPVSNNKYLAKSCANEAYLSDSKYWQCPCGRQSPLQFKFCPYCGANFISSLKPQIKQAKALAQAKKYRTSDLEWMIHVKHTQDDDYENSCFK